jgi:hypothetical protein
MDTRTPITPDTYVEKRRNGATTFCPVCRSEDVEGGSVEIESQGIAQQQCTCPNCHHTWWDIYTIANYTELENENGEDVEIPEGSEDATIPPDQDGPLPFTVVFWNADDEDVEIRHCTASSINKADHITDGGRVIAIYPGHLQNLVK